MRILHLADRLSRRGGADNHLRDLCTALALRHRVKLAVGRRRASDPPGVSVVEVRGLAATVQSAAGLDGLDALLDEAELVHLHNVMNPEVLRRATRRARTVVTIQDHRLFCPGPGRTLPDGGPCGLRFEAEACAGCLPDPSYRERMVATTEARRSALEGTPVIVLSEYMREEVTAAGLGPVRVIPPWVEAAPEPAGPGEGTVIAGRLVAHKDPLMAWRAWKRVGGTLRVCGVGGLRNQLLGAEQLGWVSRQVLRNVLAASRVLLFPARWQEPFGIVGVEALAVGTPVIAMARGGIPEWAQAGVILVEDEDQMSEALARLSADPDQAARLGREGWERVRETYAKGRILPLYDEVLRTG
ncbi:MAG TPA: glycosyltransferase family 4 protein [Myxococcota bacterium]|nr:glycosyltransferase family 4 protein [Myxococcota bacterium]